MCKGLIVFLFLCLGFVYRAQSFTPYYYHFSKQNGTPTELVYDIYQDKKGFIWLATEQGLYRYDGKNYSLFTTEDQTSKSGSCITEDMYGRIWYSNFDGYLYYVENSKLKLFKPHVPVGYLKFAIIKNILYTIEEQGVVLYNIKTGKKIKTIAFNLKNLNSSHSDGKNFYVFSDELLVLNETKMQRVDVPSMLKNFKAGLIQNTKNGLLFTSKYEPYAILYDFKRFRTISLPSSITFIQNSSFDGKDNWLCTTDGAYKLNDEKPYFKGSNISNVFKDKNGGFWFTSINNGIFLVPNLEIQFFENEKVITELSQTNGHLLIGTQNEELFITDPEKNTSKRIFKGQNNHEIYLLKTFDSIPKIFFSSYGFRVLDFSGKTLYETETAIKDIVPLDNGNFAFAASGGCGILQLEKGKQDWKTMFPILSKTDKQLILLNSVRGKSVAFHSPSNSLYFATNKGLFAFYNGKQHAVTLNGKPLFITKLIVFKDHVFGLTQNNVLYEIDRNKVSKPSFNALIKNYKILKVSVHQDRLYLNTDNGIFVYDFSNNSFYKKLSYNQEFEFSKITEVNNKTYIAVKRGILALPIAYREKQLIPKLIIDEVRMNGENVNINQVLSFSNDQNNLQINYSLLNFTPGEKYNVFYKINNGSWHLTDENTRKLELPSLAAGNYQILLRTEDKEMQPIAIRFTIEQVFWKTWWFIAISGLLIVSFVVLYYRNQIRKINYTKQLEIDRIQLEKESNISKLKAFKSQMNPHFFYNALNTLQSYILTNERKPALNYLSQFSGLTRKILEYSEQDSISLSEEIETLSLYLELEKARFNDGLEYSIQVINVDNPQKLYIPVMLLQPYVENALKHGLLHSKRNKKLDIIFQLNDGILTISIQDNGIGLKKSRIINSLKGMLKPASFSSSAQKKRIEILNKIDDENKITINIEESTSIDGESTGTLVTITLKPKQIK